MQLLWHFVKFLGQADRAFQKKIVNFQLSEISDFAFWTPSFTNGNGEIVLKISCNSKGVKGSREYSFSDRRAVFWGQRPMQNPAVKTKFGQIWFQQGHLNIKRRHNFEAGHIIQMISFQWPLILFWNRYMDRINVVLKKQQSSCNVHIWIQNQLTGYFEAVPLKPTGAMYAPPWKAALSPPFV